MLSYHYLQRLCILYYVFWWKFSQNPCLCNLYIEVKDKTMENLFLEAVKIINPIQLVIIGLLLFYFYNRQKDEFDKKLDKLDNKIDKLEEKFEKRFEKLEARIDAVNARLDNLYRELFKKDVA